MCRPDLFKPIKQIKGKPVSGNRYASKARKRKLFGKNSPKFFRQKRPTDAKRNRIFQYCSMYNMFGHEFPPIVKTGMIILYDFIFIKTRWNEGWFGKYGLQSLTVKNIRWNFLSLKQVKRRRISRFFAEIQFLHLTFCAHNDMLRLVTDNDRKEVAVSEPSESCRMVRGAGVKTWWIHSESFTLNCRSIVGADGNSRYRVRVCLYPSRPSPWGDRRIEVVPRIHSPSV